MDTKKLNLDEFRKAISEIRTAESITGSTSYNSIRVVGSEIEFIRCGKTKSEYIKIGELFDFYTNAYYYNTSIAKSYISGRVQSPAVAILNKILEITK